MNSAAPKMRDPGLQRSLRVLVIADHLVATQVISFERPLAGLIQAGLISLRMVTDREFGRRIKESRSYWKDFTPDVVFLSRYTGRNAKIPFLLSEESGIPVVFHLDDDLLDVPMSIGPEKYAAYTRPDRVDTLKWNINTCHLVYASTPGLKGALERHGIESPLVAGDVYCSVDAHAMRPRLPATGPVIGYMGTGTHAADLAQVAATVERLMDEWPMLRFELYGGIAPPDRLARFGARVGTHAGVADYAGFLDKLCDLGWWIGIAPLEDTRFNGCKADTKWVEYSFAGMAVVAQDLGVYHRACADGCGLIASSEEEWYRALSVLLTDAERRRSLVENARRKLATVYTHDRLERQILDVIDQASALARARPRLETTTERT